MLKKQQGSVTDIFLLCLLTLLALFWAYGYTQASPEDIQAVVLKAKPSAAATTIVRSALAEHPTPTINELADFRRKVDNQLSLEIARTVTGNASLQGNSEKQPTVEQPTEFDSFVGLMLKWGWLAIIVFGGVWILLFAYRKFTND